MSDEFWEKLQYDVNKLYWGLDEVTTITDYQALDKGSFEIVVLHDLYEDSYGFLVMLNREKLTYGTLDKPVTAGEVLARYFKKVDYWDGNEGVRLEDVRI